MNIQELLAQFQTDIKTVIQFAAIFVGYILIFFYRKYFANVKTNLTTAFTKRTSSVEQNIADTESKLFAVMDKWSTEIETYFNEMKSRCDELMMKTENYQKAIDILLGETPVETPVETEVTVYD